MGKVATGRNFHGLTYSYLSSMNVKLYIVHVDYKL